MKYPVISVDMKVTVKKAAEVMKKRDISCLAITKDGIPFGVLSEQDMTRRVVASNLDAKKTLVKDVMTKKVISVSPNEEFLKTASLLRENHVKRIFIIEKKKFVGILSLTDVINVLSG